MKVAYAVPVLGVARARQFSITDHPARHGGVGAGVSTRRPSRVPHDARGTADGARSARPAWPPLPCCGGLSRWRYWATAAGMRSIADIATWVRTAPLELLAEFAAGGFAVHHAAQHNLDRVIIAVPFLSITEQNAAVYRGLFGAENVLEHHSGVDLDDLPAEQRWQRLAAENWDAPVVVTTTVRLFESLFSRKPAAMRKLHRLAGAVIVLDEVQSLPEELLVPILSALRHLSEHFGTSVLLASATQPEFFSLRVFQDLKPQPVIVEPQPLYDRLRRVRFEWRCDPKPTFGQIAHEVADAHQVLLVVNTTRDAGVPHTAIEHVRRCGGPMLHLSTRMAGAHRRDTLEQIRRLLAEQQPVAVVSTQLVEAGVDLDFPLVYRAFAPAEAPLQAAGRCNRNGLVDEDVVVVFEPADGSVRGTRMVYGTALGATRSYFGPGRDPDRLDLLTTYYNTRYAVKNIDNASLGTRIQRLRADFDFIKVAGCRVALGGCLRACSTPAASITIWSAVDGNAWCIRRSDRSRPWIGPRTHCACLCSFTGIRNRNILAEHSSKWRDPRESAVGNRVGGSVGCWHERAGAAG